MPKRFFSSGSIGDPGGSGAFSCGCGLIGGFSGSGDGSPP